MEIAELIRYLDREGGLLAEAAEEAGADAKVPTCPEWQVRDLLRHTGMVHRWATAFVAEGHTSYHPDGGLPELDGAELLTWFRDGHRGLVETLTTAPPDVECWSFLPAPSPLAFWARRQANETTVHRVDAESARGGTPTAIPVDFAVDGIDELLLGFHARSKSRVRTDEPRVLRVRASDSDAVWSVRLSAEPPAAERGEVADADCELAGTAAQLYLALWNRAPLPGVTGDPSIATLWRERSAVTWS
ncbi:maleylpyruvate isomerase family mycothiol-dependent enzyme [Streptomyces phaeochromogenes]|uniref:maleylpyruvate isomerase family mycothiol-dependent enzyme n=1 Tax=Streptomyces phaeochromogenes TaxID=1923 RepID=UPI0006E30B1F|nr:maleylpyruvate isomerase family mycothiol-dependent enzyme [Streptomyces phaeochromogenes]